MADENAITIAAATLAAEFQRQLSRMVPNPVAPRYDTFVKCHEDFVGLLSRTKG